MPTEGCLCVVRPCLVLRPLDMDLYNQHALLVLSAHFINWQECMHSGPGMEPVVQEQGDHSHSTWH